MAGSVLDPKEQERVDAALAHVRNRLLVFSGKGGVGKTTVAVNIAAGLALEGRKVGILDVDIHGPNVAKMLGVDDATLEMDEAGKMKPVTAPGGIKVLSMAFLMQTQDAPVVWRGPMKMRAITQFVSDVNWGDLDWLVIDSPPGTGDEPLTVAQIIPATAAVIVTTPQQIALLDSRKAVNFAQLMKLKVLGVVENMSTLLCPHCGKEIGLYPTGGGMMMAREMMVPYLGGLPIDPAIVSGGDTGKPFVSEHPKSEAAKAMMQIVARLLEAEAK
jgi:ATP-binding protein involved in chromosome partitioning